MCSNLQVEDNHLKLRDVINIVQSVLHRWNLFVKLSWVTLSYWLWFSGALSHYPWGTTTGTFGTQLFKANFCCSACVNLVSSSPTHTSIPQLHFHTYTPSHQHWTSTQLTWLFTGTCFTIWNHWKTGCLQRFGQNTLSPRCPGRCYRSRATQIW